jgi:tRNA(Ile)-lysidine synthase
MLSRVLRTIREQALLEVSEQVLVAVSGGPDSMALLLALGHFASRLSIKLICAIVDHGMRPESRTEAAMVAERCRALGVGCEILTVDVKAAHGPHVSWQEAARNARLAKLQEAAVRLGCSKVALGHTADDQAETILFRIVRGTGLAGLAGIPYRRGMFIRPLLDVRRKEILAYLAKRRIPFIQDPSNANRRYARARIRHDLLPQLAKENPRVVEALLALAEEARALPAGASPTPDFPALPRRAAALVQRLAAEGHGTRRVSVPHGEVVVSYGKVSFQSGGGREAVPMPLAESNAMVAGPGTYRLPGHDDGPALELQEGKHPAEPPAVAAIFDAARIALPLYVRAWRPGDRMRPRGGRGSRKVADLLVDAKIPQDRRRALPLLVAADGAILFVAGLRPSEVGRPLSGTDHWVSVRSV